MLSRWYAELAWLGGDQADAGVVVDCADGQIRSVTAGVATPPAGAVRLPGLTLPGLANAHSHAFHRALRGRTQAGAGTFWSWRTQMYEVAARLDPDTYYALARATYAEMALAGITCVGEFHYLHHGPGGAPYDDPNAMGNALIAAAGDAGIRITLLDTCYLAGGFTAELSGPQLRFGDGTADRWAQRAGLLTGDGHVRIGAAIHSVRAVPASDLEAVAGWARSRAAPLHVHLSEQRTENDECLAAHDSTPAEMLDAHGVLGPGTIAVHATHLTGTDIDLLGRTGTTTCLCPTTERDLGDGIGPARALARAGSPLAVGSDSHAVIDLLEEARGMELDQRLATETRGNWRAAELLSAATATGHRALGWPEAGRIAAGAPADFVTIRLDTVRAAGWVADTALETAVFAATAADICNVVVGGRLIVSDGQHLLVDDVPGALHTAIATVTG